MRLPTRLLGDPLLLGVVEEVGRETRSRPWWNNNRILFVVFRGLFLLRCMIAAIGGLRSPPLFQEPCFLLRLPLLLLLLSYFDLNPIEILDLLLIELDGSCIVQVPCKMIQYHSPKVEYSRFSS